MFPFRAKLLLPLVAVITFTAFRGSEGVKHFNTFPRIKYVKIPIILSEDTVRAARSYTASLKRIYPQSGLSLKISQSDDDDDHITINIYKSKKRIFRFHPEAYA